MKELAEIAYKENLKVGNTTEGANGSPKNLREVIVCLKAENFEQIKRIANENDLRIISLHKKGGWDLWKNRTI